MRYPPNPNDTYDAEEIRRLGAEPWQIDLLKLNPAYNGWCPGDEYMNKEGEGWESPQAIEGWKNFKWGLDDLNEVVNFYFDVDRNADDCSTCDTTCYHPDAQWISESFYSHSSPFEDPTGSGLQALAIMAGFGAKASPSCTAIASFPDETTLAKYGEPFRTFCEEMREHGHWSDRITEDEAAMLVAEGRSHNAKTAEEFNKAERSGKGLDTHDGINRGILIKQRCERLGVPLYCPDCEGHGYIYNESEAHVDLMLWFLHPRKGASRGVKVQNITLEDLREVFAYLREAAERNAQRFSKIPTE